MKIIGITGTIGSGKGTIVDFLINTWGFKHLSVRDYLLEIIAERGLVANRDSMVLVANELRANHVPSFIIDELYRKAIALNTDCIIESIRTPGEIDSLRKKENFHLFAVDADPKIRFDRITIRNSVTDNINFEEFVANEQREMTSTDPNHQNLQRCIQMADFNFDNNGSIEDLHHQVEKIIHKINQK
jgi:hypothetical protein